MNVKFGGIGCFFVVNVWPLGEYSLSLQSKLKTKTNTDMANVVDFKYAPMFQL